MAEQPTTVSEPTSTAIPVAVPEPPASALDQLDADCRALFEVVPEDGSTIGNKAAREALGWNPEETTERYFAVRDRLEDAGLILRGRGRGGTIRRNSETADESETTAGAQVAEPAPEAGAAPRESDLYEPMRGVIAGRWARERRAEPIEVEITAHQGSRATGIWARPDITSIEIRVFPHVPGKYLEVITFEVKPSDAISVQAVYEALAHRRAATHSYVLLHVPGEQRKDLELEVSEVCEVARGHGIGVISAEDPGDHETWEEREVAARFEPDPERLEKFIAHQMSKAAGDAIAVKLR